MPSALKCPQGATTSLTNEFTLLVGQAGVTHIVLSQIFMAIT